MYFIISFLHTAILPSLGSTSRYYAFELMAGVEPATSSLPRMRSTTELHQQHELKFARLEKHECINKKSERKTGLKPATPSLEG